MLNIEFIYINQRYLISCESTYTKNGFKHTAKLFNYPMVNSYLKNGIIWNYLDSVKITYLNRTWEKYAFESVIFKLVKSWFKNDYQNVLDIIGE